MQRRPQRVEFYPGDLRAQVDEFLTSWRIPDGIPGDLVAGVAPHAGWRYSGRVAARTFHTLAVRTPPTSVVLLGAVHRPGVPRPAIYASGEWRTPTGRVTIDEPLAARLLAACDGGIIEDAGAHDDEHALEVLVPFVELLMPGCKIVPIAFPPVADAVEIGSALGRALVDDRTVPVVASTDLTHYGAHFGFVPAGVGPEAERWMRTNDARMIQKLRDLEADEIEDEAATHQNACGPGAVAATVASARARGRNEGHLLEYTTSHRVTGERLFESAVGYAGMVI